MTARYLRGMLDITLYNQAAQLPEQCPRIRELTARVRYANDAWDRAPYCMHNGHLE